MKRILQGIFPVYLLLAGLLNPSLMAQNDSTALPHLKPGRFAAVLATEATLATGTLVGLNELWYKDYPRSSFHFFNDNAEWLQMDKFGHVYAAYQISHLGYASLKWSGISERKSAWFGGMTGFTYQLIIEMLDGFSAEWGFSAGDLAGNAGGAALFTAQQLLWKEQRILLKYSCHLTPYAKANPGLLGSGVPARLLKDYNGQTQWLSVSPGSFLRNSGKFPPWLCFSLGIAANGMLGARDNDGFSNTGLDLNRSRSLLFSMDIDFSKIKVRSKFVHSLLSLINIVKMPLPALEYQIARGKFQGHWIYF